MELTRWGWNRALAAQWRELSDPELQPARVIREATRRWRVVTSAGERVARVSGRLRHSGARPAVGDWVAIETGATEAAVTIRAILPRRSQFSRKVPGETTREQIIAANLDWVFVVSGLDGDFNLRRIERFLTLAWSSGAKPILILNKADLSPDVDQALAQARRAAGAVAVHATSAATGTGLESLMAYLTPGTTVALLGSSGTGKSTILNRLSGIAHAAVGPVRTQTSRGRHTTTHREMIVLPGGALVIDTPGLRELQLWGDDDGLRQAFDEITRLADGCRFRDCRHRAEPGCAVLAAIERGDLEPERHVHYMALQRELDHLARRQTERGRTEQRREGRLGAKALRRVSKLRS